MPAWRQVEAPAYRPKQMDLTGCRTAISAVPTASCPYAVMVAADYARREYVCWFQDQGEQRVPWLDSDPQGFSAFAHPMADGTLRLKIAVSQYGGNFAGVFDTGWSFFP